MRSILVATVVLLAACSPDEPQKPASSAPASDATPSAPAVTASTPAATPAAPVALDRGDGLTVEIETAGKGAEVASDSSVTLHYRAFVAGADKPFDSSYESGVPLEVALGSNVKPRVIDGLARGLIGLRAGTRAKLNIPAKLGWGSEGNEGAGVPKDSGLVYEVDVVAVR